ncbi:MAG TPA: M20/M25/M40 family metallo-hydrolase [Gaiellaceae bacterium]|nr:M20/M25/M40 family metallo-hydrolase [Gaiellaceae bacterium]
MLTELTGQLVAIDSVNPTLAASGAGEAAVARVLAEWLERAGLEVHVEEVAAGRPNVVGVARGSGGGKTLLLNGHLDTVGLLEPDGGLAPRVDGGRLYGRGAYDMKASLAAIASAGAECARRGLRGDVIVTAVVDEEAASIGTEALVERWRADAAIVAEPTDERLCIAHRGWLAFDIETLGRAAHGSRPDLGIDAIAKMGRILVEIESLDRSLQARPSHPLLGTGSVHASLIEGGQEYSSYPARCLLSGERRTIPGERREDVEAELAGLLGDSNGSIAFPFGRDPMEISRDEEIVRAVQAETGSQEVFGAPFWTDAALFADAGIPAILFGPRGDGAHAAVEWVDLASVERCRDLFVAVAAEFCG